MGGKSNAKGGVGRQPKPPRPPWTPGRQGEPTPPKRENPLPKPQGLPFSIQLRLYVSLFRFVHAAFGQPAVSRTEGAYRKHQSRASRIHQAAGSRQCKKPAPRWD